VPAQLVCKSKSAQQWENNNKYWTVTAEFDNEPQNTESDTGGNEGDTGDPTAWFAIAKFDFETIDVPMIGEVNFAKRPYSPPITYKKLIPVLKFTQYLPPDVTIYDLIISYHDVVNNNTFLGGRSRSWLLTVAGAEFGVTNGYECWKVNFELRYLRLRVHDSNATYAKVYDADGNDVTTSSGIYPGWDLYIPQIDTVDKNRRPFSDIFENSGEAGKLGTDGLFLSDQDAEPLVIKRHQIPDAEDFSFIRIRQQ